MNILKISLLSFVLLFTLGLVCLAQETSSPQEPITSTEAVNLDEKVQPEDLEVSEPKLLPDSPFYFLKNWARNLRMFFSFRPEKKAELRLKFANEKIIELNKLAELKKDPRIIEKALESFQKELTEIEKAKIENLKKFSEKLMDQQLLHQRILEKLEKQVPPEVAERIKENRERHLERFAKVIEKVEEKFPEKLAKVLEKQKGSEFKQFKVLENLTEIEEKVSPEIKEEIKKKKEKILEEFQKKLETLPAKEKEKFKEYLEKVGGDKLTHLKILEEMMNEETSDKLRENLEEIEEKEIEDIEKLKTTPEKAEEQIKKAEDEIKKAEEKVSTSTENEYGGKAARRLLELAKKHLKEAERAFEEKKYGKAFGLATAAYHEALNTERIVEKNSEIKKSPEKIKEKFEKLYPGIELPETIQKCPLPAKPECGEGEVWRIGKDKNGCPIFSCEKIREMEGKPKVCPMLWDPVCGKNGKTYSNECFAKVAEVEIDYKGVCKEKEAPCAKEGEKVNRNPLLGQTNRLCCPGLKEERVSKSYSICKKAEEIVQPPTTTPECKEGETKKYQCPDGTFVNWCSCYNEKWVCIISPEIACPTTTKPTE